mmetsp:Transcript_20467/g.40952  ORF Transcript_20467/g.40952 Transcript_20467/m.40952 type:complete len:215 (-) Transcript_20467:156-800(-)
MRTICATDPNPGPTVRSSAGRMATRSTSARGRTTYRQLNGPSSALYHRATYSAAKNAVMRSSPRLSTAFSGPSWIAGSVVRDTNRELTTTRPSVPTSKNGFASRARTPAGERKDRGCGVSGGGVSGGGGGPVASSSAYVEPRVVRADRTAARRTGSAGGGGGPVPSFLPSGFVAASATDLPLLGGVNDAKPEAPETQQQSMMRPAVHLGRAIMA